MFERLVHTRICPHFNDLYQLVCVCFIPQVPWLRYCAFELDGTMEKKAGETQDNWAALYGFCRKISLYRLPHDLIVLKLRKYGADGKTINFINDCLSG